MRGQLVSDSEIVEWWHGKQVPVSLVARGRLRGKLVRSDATGAMFAVEEMAHNGPGGSRIGMERPEGSLPIFRFVPWSQIEMIVPLLGDLP